MKLPKFKEQKELFDFLSKNRDMLIHAKKTNIKEVDCIKVVKSELVNKEPLQNVSELQEIKVNVIINTTNIIDSHNDLHLPGLWTKSLQENKYLMHLQEHQRDFDKIIADGDDLKAYTQMFKFSDLGEDLNGNTQALVFESIVKRDRNEYMFNQYANGYVKQHSVGMQYIKIQLAINDPDYPEFEIWKKYVGEVANVEKANEEGYFYVVLEAKVLEGSAVPLGSNHITPTQSVEEIKEIKTEPVIEPSADTQKETTQQEFINHIINKL